MWHWKPNVEETSAYLALLMFFTYVVTDLVRGFAGRRPKNHWTRQRARARRLAR